MLTSGPMWVVCAALFDDAGRVLMQRRPLDKQHGGLWEFPGGKVEPGERPVAALVRELAEELGIVVAAEDLMPVTFADAPPVALLLYRCTRWTGVPSPAEGALLRWCLPSELTALPMPPADIPLAAALIG